MFSVFRVAAGSAALVFMVGIPANLWASSVTITLIDPAKPVRFDNVSQAYDYTVIAEARDEDMELAEPALADDGRAVWRESRKTASGLPVSSLMLGDENGAIEIAREGQFGTEVLEYSEHSISGNGTVVFLRQTAGAEEILVRAPNGQTTLIDSEFLPLYGGDRDIDCRGRCSVSDGGVAGWGETKGPSFTRGDAFVGAGGAPGVFPGGVSAGTPGIRVTDGGAIFVERDDQIRRVNGDGSSVLRGVGFSVGDFAANDADTVLFRDTGGVGGRPNGIYLGAEGSAFGVPVIDDTGPLDGFGRLNLNDFGGIAYTARRDFGPDGVFAGADVVKDAVLSEGDILFGEEILAFGFVEDDGLNDAGALVFRVTQRDGSGAITSRIVRADPKPLIKSYAVADARLKLLAGDGQSALIARDIMVPDGAFSLTFGLDFLYGDAALKAMLGGQSIGVFAPDESGIYRIDVFPEFLRGARGISTLAFELAGGAGAVGIDDILLDDRVIADFDTGYLEGWAFDGDGGALVQATALAPVPLPSAAGLLLLGFSGLGWLHRRGRRRG